MKSNVNDGISILHFRYENSADFKRETVIRNISNRYRKRKEKEEATAAKPPVPPTTFAKRERREIKIEKPAEPKPVVLKAVDNNKDNAMEVATPKKSWRDRVNEQKQKEDDEETRTMSRDSTIKVESATEKAKTAGVKAKDDGDAAAKTSNTNAGDDDALDEFPRPDLSSKREDKENEDITGTKKLKGDFDKKMEEMEKEMQAGKSKLAKLRERIRKAKGVIKAADDAVEKSM